jgi:hypothetical protein
LISGSMILSDGELRTLARGIVPLRVRVLSLQLSQSLAIKLQKNAARRPKATPAAAREDR